MSKNRGHPTDRETFSNGTLKCGAKTRNGGKCQRAGTGAGNRCRKHGGMSTGAPKGNTNRMTHGAYLKTMFSNLTQEELDMVDKVEKDPLAELEYQIAIATVREKRMLDRLNKLKDDEFTVTQIEDTVTQNGTRQSSEKKTIRENNLVLISKLEEHITKVQNAKTKMIAQKATILNSRQQEDKVDISKVVDAITTTSENIWIDDDEEE